MQVQTLDIIINMCCHFRRKQIKVQMVQVAWDTTVTLDIKTL